MRYLRIFAAGLLGAGALFGLFTAFCILPKVTLAEHGLQTVLPGWISTSASITDDWMLYSIYFLAAVLLVTLVVALMPFIAESARRAACGIIYVIAILTSASAIYLLTVAAAGMIFVNEDLSEKNRIYASVLDQFFLKESANGKFEEIQAFIAKINSLKLIEVKDANTLSKEQKSEQIRGLIYGLKSSDDVGFFKQILATTDLFRTDIAKNPGQAKLVLRAAATCGAPSDDINKFYDWLEPKIGTDGWNSQPLHVMVFDK